MLFPALGCRDTAASLKAANAATGAPVTRLQSSQWQKATAVGVSVDWSVVVPQ
jgi:hypothetical protein